VLMLVVRGRAPDAASAATVPVEPPAVSS
jgi:hypothetical protein